MTREAGLIEPVKVAAWAEFFTGGLDVHSMDMPGRRARRHRRAAQDLRRDAARNGDAADGQRESTMLAGTKRLVICGSRAASFFRSPTHGFRHSSIDQG
jgi:hypothetical protein